MNRPSLENDTLWAEMPPRNGLISLVAGSMRESSPRKVAPQAKIFFPSLLGKGTLQEVGPVRAECGAGDASAGSCAATPGCRSCGTGPGSGPGRAVHQGHRVHQGHEGRDDRMRGFLMR